LGSVRKLYIASRTKTLGEPHCVPYINTHGQRGAVQQLGKNMDKQAFVTDYLARNAAQVRRKGAAYMTAVAEAEFAKSQDPAAQLVKKLATVGKYWSNADESKVRVYFNEVTVPGVSHLVNGYYDAKAQAWVIDGCDEAAFVAAAMGQK
jgi:hypothetical protein